jgi:hypothetical protein
VVVFNQPEPNYSDDADVLVRDDDWDKTEKGDRTLMTLRSFVRISVAAMAATTMWAQEASLKIEQVMTPEELRETGVGTLTTKQREALNHWLNHYTKLVISVAQHPKPQEANAPTTTRMWSSCTPAIESTISGDFEGWDGETIFKLDNGQIWQQSEYDYTYDYEYHPDVTIYQTSAGCRMKVEGLDETILVRRIK